MARTHGTRSAYNAGCRCDACRETARLARARQRQAASVDGAGWSSEGSVALSEGVGVPWVAVGLVSLGAGGFAVWHGTTMRPDDADGDGEAFRRSRRRWVVVGGVLVTLGVVALTRA